VVIMGKTNMTQWNSFRGPNQGNGWSADLGQTYGVYCYNQDPGGSSAGSASATALGLAHAALGTEVSQQKNPGWILAQTSNVVSARSREESSSRQKKPTFVA